MPNKYFAEEAIAGPVSTQPRWYWKLPPVVQLRWLRWPPSPQPLQMSGGQPEFAPVTVRGTVGNYATTTVVTPTATAPASTEGLRSPAQADILIGGAYPLPNY